MDSECRTGPLMVVTFKTQFWILFMMQNNPGKTERSFQTTQEDLHE